MNWTQKDPQHHQLLRRSRHSGTQWDTYGILSHQNDYHGKCRHYQELVSAEQLSTRYCFSCEPECRIAQLAWKIFGSCIWRQAYTYIDPVTPFLSVSLENESYVCTKTQSVCLQKVCSLKSNTGSPVVPQRVDTLCPLTSLAYTGLSDEDG